MSHIVDALILDSNSDREGVAALNLDLERRDEIREQHFHRIEGEPYAGLKVFCADIYICAFNHFPAREIEAAFAAAPWKWPERVVLIVDPYDSDEDPRSCTAAELRESDESVTNDDGKGSSQAK